MVRPTGHERDELLSDDIEGVHFKFWPSAVTADAAASSAVVRLEARGNRFVATAAVRNGDISVDGHRGVRPVRGRGMRPTTAVPASRHDGLLDEAIAAHRGHRPVEEVRETRPGPRSPRPMRWVPWSPPSGS